MIKEPRPANDEKSLELMVANVKRIGYDKYGMPSGHSQNCIFSLVYIITFYNLSLNKKGFLYFLFTFDLLEVILIYLFHNSLTQVIKILVILMTTLFILMFINVIRIKDGKIINNNPSI